MPDNDLIIFISGYFFAIFSYIDYFKNKMVKNPYVLYLSFFSVSLFYLTLWHYSEILNEETFFYLLSISLLFAAKFGSKLQDFMFSETFMLKADDSTCFDGILATIFESFSLTNGNLYLNKGFFRNHFRKVCQDPQCKLLQTSDFFDKRRFSHNGLQFIKLRFLDFISNKRLNLERKEQIVFKYLDFLMISKTSSLTVSFELQKSKFRLKSKTMTSRLQLILLEEKIHSISQEEQSRDSIVNEDFIGLTDYFKFVKDQGKFRNLALEILMKKKNFWSNYLTGFKSLDALFIAIKDVMHNIHHFEKRLQDYNRKMPKNILTIKLRSMLYCLFYNDLNKGLKYETDFDVELIKERLNYEKMMNKLSFLNKEIVICEASFLNYDGKLQENSKTEKLATFFGFSKLEIQNIETIAYLMPKTLSEKHAGFVENYLNNAMNTMSSFSQKSLKTFAYNNKGGYIMPVTLFFGVRNTLNDNDFVIMSAILPDEENKMLMIFGGKGEILGLTQNFLRYLDKKVPHFAVAGLYNLKISELIPDIQGYIDNVRSCKILRNVKTILKIPIFLSEMAASNKISKRMLGVGVCRQFKIVFDFTIQEHFYEKTEKITIFSVLVNTIFKSDKKNKESFCYENYVMNLEQDDNINDGNALITESSANKKREYPKFFLAEQTFLISNSMENEKKKRAEEKEKMEKKTTMDLLSPNKAKSIKETSKRRNFSSFYKFRFFFRDFYQNFVQFTLFNFLKSVFFSRFNFCQNLNSFFSKFCP